MGHITSPAVGTGGGNMNTSWIGGRGFACVVVCSTLLAITLLPRASLAQAPAVTITKTTAAPYRTISSIAAVPPPSATNRLGPAVKKPFRTRDHADDAQDMSSPSATAIQVQIQ